MNRKSDAETWLVTVEGDSLELHDAAGEHVATEPLTRTGSRRLFETAIASGAVAVRFPFNLRLIDD